MSSYDEFKMRENKLPVKVTATAEASGSSGTVHYIKIGYGRLSTQWHMRRAESIMLIGTAGCGFYGPTDSQL